MTKLSLAARNTLAKDPAIRALVGSDNLWTDGWVFDSSLYNVVIEGTSKCAIVVSEVGTHDIMNQHNTLKFPRLEIDIWADPTRNTDGSKRLDDADDKIEAIAKVVDNHFHLVSSDTPAGDIIVWGSTKQITEGKGLYVAGSSRISGPDVSPIEDVEGGLMGRYVYGVHSIN